jgi:hypothetical protein
MRRKLKKFKRLIEAGKMNFADLRTAYQSWRGNFRKRFNACYCISRMDALYHALFLQNRDPTDVSRKKSEDNNVSCKEKWEDVLPQKS